MNPVATVKLEVYKTNVGLFVRNLWGSHYNQYSSTSYFNSYKFNGQSFGNTLHGGYLLLKDVTEITKVEMLTAASNVHTGFKLKDSAPETLKSTLKAFYALQEVGVFDYVDDEKTFSNQEFNAISSMYEPTFEKTEPKWEERPFEIVVLGEYVVENYEQPEKMTVKFCDGNYGGKIAEVDLSSVVCYQDIERILTPEFLLHNRPCSLSSSQVYKIVRAHVKENINPRAAEITSDYEFCFTVKRKVHKQPVTTRTEIKKANGRSYATPKFKTETSSVDLVTIFEMTDSSHRYGKYPVISDWQAENLLDMQGQVKYYLDTLMEEINKEVDKCPHCNGAGAIVKKIGTNER